MLKKPFISASLIVIASTLFAASPQNILPPSINGSHSSPSQHKTMTTMPLIAPLFVENGELSSSITVVNAAAAASSAQVILLDQQGTQVIKKTITLNGHSQIVLSVSELLKQAHALISIGSVQIVPEPKAAKNMSVVAQLSIVDSGRVSPAYLEEEFFMPTSKSSNIFRSVSSSVLGYPVLALVSLSAEPQNVTVNCITEHSRSWQSTIQIAPNEMVLTEVCDAANERISDFQSSWHQKASNAKRSIGISVTTTGMPGELGVYGFALSGEHDNPSYTALAFNDIGTVRSSNTVFVGVPVGRTDLLPGDIFNPEIALANFGAEPATANVLYATTDSNAPASKTVATVTLQPQSSQNLVLPALSGDAQMRNSFIIQSNASPGTLAANLSSIGASTSRIVQLLGKDQQQSQNGGSHPWTRADRATSTLLLFNHSQAVESFSVRVSAGSMLWQQDYDLAPLETKTLTINDLITEGIKDQRGKIMPKDSVVGEVNWSTPQFGKGTGRLLVSQPDVLLARNFSCGENVVMCGLDMENYALNLLIDTSGAMGPLTASYCITEESYGCSGNYDYKKATSGQWSTSNDSIASITSADISAQVYGRSGGSAEISVISNDYCGFGAGGTAGVQIPTSISVISAKALPPLGYGQGCNSGDYGFLSDIVYQVLDQGGQPIKNTTMEPQEKDLNFIFNGTNYGDQVSEWADIMGGTSQITAGRKNTDVNGQFEDAPFGTCGNGISFTATYTQPISVLVGGSSGRRYSVRTNNWTQTGTAVASGRTKNGVDVDVSQ